MRERDRRKNRTIERHVQKKNQNMHSIHVNLDEWSLAWFPSLAPPSGLRGSFVEAILIYVACSWRDTCLERGSLTVQVFMPPAPYTSNTAVIRHSPTHYNCDPKQLLLNPAGIKQPYTSNTSITLLHIKHNGFSTQLWSLTSLHITVLHIKHSPTHQTQLWWVTVLHIKHSHQCPEILIKVITMLLNASLYIYIYI